jgi:hypothetical protein
MIQAASEAWSLLKDAELLRKLGKLDMLIAEA